MEDKGTGKDSRGEGGRERILEKVAVLREDNEHQKR